MGRKPLLEEEKKINVKLRIKKKYYDYLKEHNINISRLLEQKIEELLNK